MPLVVWALRDLRKVPRCAQIVFFLLQVRAQQFSICASVWGEPLG